MAIALDRLSTLPDSLLCLILSKLPFRRVVQCSVLSKRWRFIYREMPNLDLCPIVLTPQYAQHPTPDPLFIATFEHIISNILQSHSSDLADVCLTNYTDDSMDIRWRFTRQSVSNWLECLSRKNVKKLIFSESPERESPAPEALFSCTALTYLTLNNYILTRIPTQFAGFKHLLKCTFTSIELTDDSLAIFISQCPLLLNLRLLECVGLREPVISALKVTDLALNVHGLQVLTVKCPKLKNFANLGYFASFPEEHEISGRIKDLRANGVSFRELSPAVKSFEMHLGNNLISLLLDLSTRDGGYNCPADRFFQIVGSLKSLKVLDIAFSSLGGPREVAVPILSLLGRLPNLEHFGLKGRPILVRKYFSSSFYYCYILTPYFGQKIFLFFLLLLSI
jgi:hypothetical protein